jgi:hypothetical protein
MATDISNLSNILYMAFRLAPFLIVTFFTMSSIFNYDYKGIIYLCGLLLTSVIAISIGNTGLFSDNIAPSNTNTTTSNTILICNSLALSENGPLSKIPLSILVTAYTGAYLLYFIYLANAWVHNISTYIIFLALIFGQIYWTLTNRCAQSGVIIASVLIGIGGGVLWGLLINNIGISHLGFFNGLGNQNVCSIPKKQTFKCTKRSKSGA